MGNSNPHPVSVYPDPDGSSNSNFTAPSDTRLTAASLVSAGVAAGAAAIGSGNVLPSLFLFLQAREAGGFLGFHAAGGTYVAIAFVFASLSAILSAINLIYGLRMKERLRELSARVSAACAKEGVFDWWRTKRAA
jgi:hypothetical protein